MKAEHAEGISAMSREAEASRHIGIWRSKVNPNVTARVLTYKHDGIVEYQLSMTRAIFSVEADIWNKLWEKT